MAPLYGYPDLPVDVYHLHLFSHPIYHSIQYNNPPQNNHYQNPQSEERKYRNNGYINNRCSSDILKLCYQYYKNPVTLLINFEKQIEIMTPHRSAQPYIPQRARLESPNTPNASEMSHHISPLCHIPNISSIIKIPTTLKGKPKKSLDGIILIVQTKQESTTKSGIMTVSKSNSGPRAAIYLFDSYEVNKSSIFPIYIVSSSITWLNKYLVNGGIFRYGSFINCGSHGVIWDCNGDLLQLKWSDIDLSKQSPSFIFKPMNIKHKNGCMKYARLTEYEGGYTKRWRFIRMRYLPHIDKIMGIYHEWEQDSVYPTFTTRCGLFDFAKKDWFPIKGFTVTNGKLKDERYHYELCHNMDNDPNIVYAVGATGHALKYDIKKDEWTELCELACLGYTAIARIRNLNTHSVWVDDIGLLYYLSGNAKKCVVMDTRANDDKHLWKHTGFKHPGFGGNMFSGEVNRIETAA